MSTTSSNLAGTAQSQFQAILSSHYDQATKAKNAYHAQVEQIQANDMISDKAKDLEKAQAHADVTAQLEAIRAQQDQAVQALQQRYVDAYRGHQPDDAGSVRLRREAMQDARALNGVDDLQNALDDAIHNNDPAMAHAIGHVSRTAFPSVWASYAGHFPQVAEASEAMLVVQELATGSDTNVANSITYSTTNVDE